MVCPQNGAAVLKGLTSIMVDVHLFGDRDSCTGDGCAYFFCASNKYHTGTKQAVGVRTAVPFWRQMSQIPSSLSPKRDSSSKRVNNAPGKMSCLPYPARGDVCVFTLNRPFYPTTSSTTIVRADSSTPERQRLFFLSFFFSS